MICTVCREVPAEVFSTAEKASLCTECDGRLHPSAQPGACVPLTAAASMPACDVCQEECSTFFCKECRALLCPSCDGAMHRTPIACAHSRFVISSTRVGGGAAAPEANDRSVAGANAAVANHGGSSGSDAPQRLAERAGAGAGVRGAGAGPSGAGSEMASGRGMGDGYNADTSGMFVRGGAGQGGMPTMSFVDGNPVAELLHIPSLGDEYGIKDVDVDDFFGLNNAEWEGLQNALFEAPQSVPGSAGGGDFGFGGAPGAAGYDDESAVPDFGAPAQGAGPPAAGAPTKRQRMMY